MLSLVKVLAPSLTLLAAAALVATLPARSRFGPAWSRGVAALSLLVALLLATLQVDQTASFAGVPLGPVSVSLIQLRYTPLALAWLQLLFLGTAALVLVSPVAALPKALALVAVSAPALMVGSFPALCLAWFLVEVAFAAVGPSPATGNTWFPLLFGTAAVLAAFHTSASDEALTLSLGSLAPVSWLLIVIAVSLRCRWWSPASLASPGVLPSAPFLVAAATGFFTLSHLESMPRGGEVPQWVGMVLLLACIGASLMAWARRRSEREAAVRSAAALLLPLLLLEGVSLPPAPWASPAAAHVLAAVIALTVLQYLDRPAWLPGWVLTAAGGAVAVTLLPWPILPYGRAVASALEALSAGRPAAAVVLSLATGLPAAALLAGARREGRGIAQTSAQVSTTLAALILALLCAYLAWSLSAAANQSNIVLLYSDPSLGAVAMAVLGGFIGLVVAVADRAGLLLSFDTVLPAGMGASLSQTSAWLGSRLSAAAETIFRFLEGETPLTWAVLIGAAVLVLAAGQL